MKAEKKPNNYCKPPKTDSMKVEEPLTLYGNNFVLSLDEAKRYTYADYLTWLDDKRRELINGFIRMMSPAATTKHARLSHKLVYELASFIRKRKGKCQVYDAPFDVRLPNKTGETANDKIYTVVQPDICLICDLTKLDKRGCIGAPDLVIEIQSPSTTRYDVTEKYDVYEAAGVPEYWIVYPKDEAITVFLLQPNGKYSRCITYEYEGKVPVQALKGLEIDLEELFGEFENSPY
ncbi:MAG: Uma2 family endonuclease [Candidatus Azobacteroides sp.]|nr:Uma2 family endonuclease [Candidatus Azobacteroides sp.]